MDTLDSRALRYTDCFGQRFMRAGRFPYAVVRTGQQGLTDAPFAVIVDKGADGRPMDQHEVTVNVVDRRLVAQPAELRIVEGDMVLWNAPEGDTPPYAIAGEKEFFSSAALQNESGFTHAFGLPGEYEWRDANGSGLGGTVIVRPPEGTDTEAGRRRWMDQLAEGALVMIDGRRADPAKLEIVTGQTVFFIVVKAPGITITDVRLLERDPTRIVKPEPARRTGRVVKPAAKGRTVKKAKKAPAKRR
ncbi:MAG TPA: hypothetical protein VFB78_10095 [Acidimicrobiales bacterium]|nr:hypothetical protein [Acidimicrobiales bacterium]